MPTFGFSAYLKLLASNDRPQRSIIRTRLLPSADGYDFHRSLRLRIQELMSGSHTAAEVMRSIDSIIKAPERESVREGLGRLLLWREQNPGEMFHVSPAMYESPNDVFKVNFTPNFGVRVAGRDMAVHVWNTKTADLSPRIVYSALSLFTHHYRAMGLPLNDIAVLSLRNSELYPLDINAESSFLGRAMAARIEAQFARVTEELERPLEDGVTYPSSPPRMF